MPWLKLLHITAVIVWCGGLLYLLALLAAAPATPAEATLRRLPRRVFIGVATPAALVAIASGTAIFATQGPIVLWLIGKLGVVGAMVLGHASCALLLLRAERGQHRGLRTASVLLMAGTLLWLLLIAWLVLRKPM